MVRASLLLAVVFGLALAAPSLSAIPRPIASYCSTSGDVCYGIFRNGETYEFQLTTAARYFGRYSICSKPPSRAATCKRFPVRRRGQNFGGIVRFERNYPHRVTGTYRVTWKLGASPLGRTLKFKYFPIVP